MDQASVDSLRGKTRKNREGLIIAGILVMGNLVVPGIVYLLAPNNGPHTSMIAPAFWLNVLALILSGILVGRRGQQEKERGLPLLMLSIILVLTWGLFYIFSPLAGPLG